MTNAHAVHCAEHSHHVGVCPACQRARLAAEKEQLDEVQALRDVDFSAVQPQSQPARQTV
ncbi:MAG TPA: hypothetical protein VKV34_07575 [Thermoleophilia bacterium]|nr:hypothetical protein [Solirubrobacteraceae bacterium]HLK43187.1 hypothetical protein [Thermoleophilia bacterium]